MKRKDRVYAKLQELTKTLVLDGSRNEKMGFETSFISRELNLGRNNVSKELNELVREGKAVKILGKPVLYLDKVYLVKQLNLQGDVSVINECVTAKRLLSRDHDFGVNKMSVGDYPAPNKDNDVESVFVNNTVDCNDTTQNCVKENNTVLDNIIGATGSLKNQIKQAKAAIVYPPNGLHTLIVGATGVGKSTFSEAMYKYAVQVKKLPEDAPFVVFNCADYAENPQLLLSQLFGHVKGSFTGADREKKGLIDKANGGILFLDEVHRLPPEGQEMMFLLLDKGIYRKMGEDDNVRSAKVRIIAATTEDPSDHLLKTFLRRIPVTITLPNLNDLSVKERISIICSLFTEESKRIKVPIKVARAILENFIHYECPGNIGQLKSDIQLVCAKAFLEYMMAGHDTMEVKLTHIPWNMLQKFLKDSEKKEALVRASNFASDHIMFDGSKEANENRWVNRLYDDEYRTYDDFYETILKKRGDLVREGLSDQKIRQKIASHIESYFQHAFPKTKHSETDPDNKTVVESINQHVLDAVQVAFANIGEGLKPYIDKRVVYGLALHVETLLERQRMGLRIYHPNRDQIAEEHPEEYALAKRLREQLESKLNVSIPYDEVGFLTMFLYALTKGQEQSRIGVLVVAHGRSTASAMVEVANTLIGNSQAAAIDIPLGDDIDAVLNEAIEEVKRLDMGKGVIILGDMEPISNFSAIITERTGIITKSVEMVSTPMVIEAVRKAVLPDMTIDMLAQSIRSSTPYVRLNSQQYNDVTKFIDPLLIHMLSGTLAFLDTEKACSVLGHVLKMIFTQLQGQIDKQICTKFLFHCTYMIERIIRKEYLQYESMEHVKSVHPLLFRTVAEQFELVEETFGITIPHTELAYIVEMIYIHVNTQPDTHQEILNTH